MHETIENILEVRVKDEVYGFDANAVEQILVIPPITKVPLSDHSLLGVSVLGGKIINVLDLGLSLHVRQVDTEKESARLLTFSGTHEAFVVDEVLNMIAMNEKNLEENSDEDSFLSGFYRTEEDVVQILNITSLLQSVSLENFTPKEIATLSDTQTSEQMQESDETSKRALFFRCGDERFAIDIEMLRELIFVPSEITPIAGSDALGMITLREKVIPLLDMNTLLGFASKEWDEKSRVLIATHENHVVAFLVDEVEEVKNLQSTHIEEFANEFVAFIYKEEEGVASVIADDFIRKVIREYKMEREEELEEESKNEETDLSEIAVFKIKDEEYAFDIEEVQEIIRYEEVTPVPEAPAFVEGILNLRGAIISVISLAKRLGFESEIDEKTKIVVCLVSGEKIGFIVDDVNEILFVEDKFISKSASSEALFDEVINLDDGKRVILKIKSSNLIDEETLENIRKLEK